MTAKRRDWRDDPAVKRDMACVHAAMEMQLEEQLTSPTGRVADGEVEPFLVLKLDGAVERLLQQGLRQIRFAKGTDTEREALLFWLNYFRTYLALHLPAARDLYKGPLAYLAVALSDLDRGLVRPAFEPAPIYHRPTDGHIEVKFKVACVLAADTVHEAGRSPGRKRSTVSRKEADAKIFRCVKRTAEALGFTAMSEKTIDGWRKAIKKTPADDQLAVAYRIQKRCLKDVRVSRGSDAAIHWCLGRITDPGYIA